ncbi:Crp/Fnr family transcriptional regulator [Bacteroides ihuae]|uniref:Crp/Fnr family transcriptional regulator n=1 Tax=Bacteroides ihuae TaxID=1852362 RepID=UPI0008D97E72|nr:cyclic nucleotide-binding domain-containing protein [Bacteroides ihuae]
MEMMKETIDAVVNSRYPEMSLEGRKILESVLVQRNLNKGEMLIHEGQTSRHMVFVAKGMLRQYYFKNGKEVTEHFSYEGCILMCIESLLKQEPTRLVAETLEQSIVYLLPYDTLLKLTENVKEINIFYRKVLEYSLITSQIKADSWRFETARERYNLLMKTYPEVIKRAPLSYIASYLLMTPETLSRVRAGSL